ncbi:hypothetical protein HK104_000891 [Borealophlyctis nickersoniae]|nr:hypothetical protein HK104_000891 [Borealophlyctis nickersoniae]
MENSNTGVSNGLSSLPATCVDTISKNITTIKDFHAFLNTHPNIRSTARPSQYLALAQHAAKDTRDPVPVIVFVNFIPPCLLPAVDETPEEAQKGTRFFTAVVKLFKSYPSTRRASAFILYPEIVSEYVRNNRVNAIDCVVELGLLPAKDLIEAAIKVGSLSSMKSFVETYNILWEEGMHYYLYEVLDREHEGMALYLLEVSLPMGLSASRTHAERLFALQFLSDFTTLAIQKFPPYRDMIPFGDLVGENKLRWIEFLESHGYPVAATSLQELLNVAIEKGHEELVEYFLSRGASLTAPGALQSAIRCRDESWSTNLVRRAIDAGADVHQAHQSGAPEDPLWQALYYDRDDLAEMLVEAGAYLQAVMGDAVYNVLLWEDVGGMGGMGCRSLRWLLKKGCKPRSEDVGRLLRTAGWVPERVEFWKRYQEGCDVTSAPVDGAEATSSAG